MESKQLWDAIPAHFAGDEALDGYYQVLAATFRSAARVTGDETWIC